VKLKTPYANLLPPLSADERDALAASLRDQGQLAPVIVDEDGSILDGHHRRQLLGDKTQAKVLSGLSEAEKKAFVYRSAGDHRNLSSEQKREVREHMKAVALELRAEDPKKNTQTRIADRFGVSQQAVGRWLATNTTSSRGSQQPAGADVPDGRRRLNADERATAVGRVTAGESHASVAKDLGVARQTVSKLVAKAPEAQTQTNGGRQRNPKLAERDEQVAELYPRMMVDDVATKLGLKRSEVATSVQRQGLKKGKGRAKANPLAPLHKGLRTMVGQVELWTDDEAQSERIRGGIKEQYDVALALLAELKSELADLQRQLQKERP